MSKFLIERNDLAVDPLEIDSEGLTIGRLTGNDLVLNHPTVSRTHAGIKEIDEEYWIFNLSEANGTLLNGELIDRTPLADEDLIQIGPYFIYVKYEGSALQLEVEMSVSPLPVDALSSGQLQQSQEFGKTTRLDPSLLARMQRAKPTPKGARRPSGTGMLSGDPDIGDDQALKVFWDKRKREAGKLATESPLKPRARTRLGKAQFNWYPTRDLQSAWPRSLFNWGALIIGLVAVAAIFFRMDFYSPGALSTSHARSDLSVRPAIAARPNSASCTACHSVSGSMVENCAACHTTEAFDSRVSQQHMNAGLSCLSCHSEHQGTEFRPALVANAGCTDCHRDGSRVTSTTTGKPLSTPHGGSFGYPVSLGIWRWDGITQSEWERRGHPGSTSQFSTKEQFHLVHLGGRQQGRSNCTDCHIYGFTGNEIRRGVRESCAECHGLPSQAIGGQAAGRAAAPLCVSCHSQHGEEKDFRSSVRR